MKVDDEVADFIERHALVIRIDEKGYPVVFHPCRSCAPVPCHCSRPLKKIVRLHLFVWDWFNDETNPRRPGEHVHHVRHDKLDARIIRLSKGTAEQHALAHVRARRKFSYRERMRFGGFRFHPPQPAPVISRPELVGMTVSASSPRLTRPPTEKQLLTDLEKRLARLYEPLASRLARHDSGTEATGTAPRQEWLAPRSRIVGIRMPRLELTLGERVLVLLLADDGGDVDAVAAEVGERPEMIRQLMKRPGVDLALRNWRKHRTLPLLGRSHGRRH